MTLGRIALIALVAALPLTSCGPRTPVGDAKGGIIDWFAASKGQVQAAAGDHCARYGKGARVVRTEAETGGGNAIFVCE